MKKIVCFILILLICFCTSCRKKINDLPNYITKMYNIDEKVEIEYDSIDDEIDKKLFQEINNVYQKLRVLDSSNIIINTKSYINEKFASYLVKFSYNDSKFIKTYNYSIDSKSLILLNRNNLIEKINLLDKEKYNLSKDDKGFINYIIDDNNIHIYLSNKIDKETIDVKIPFDKSLLEEEEINNVPIKKVALTFDDGPSKWSKELVNLLDELDIVATFFVLGKNVEYYPNELKYIASHGHEIGNHSYSHPDFKKISIDDGILEIEKTQEIVYHTIRRYPRVFRFPYGSVKKELLNKTYLRSILWTADSLDWRVFDYKSVVEKVEKEIGNDGVILFHDFRYYNKKAIIQVVNDLKKEGYTFVTISNLYSFYSDDDFLIERNYY